jgi:hypothetical protein
MAPDMLGNEFCPTSAMYNYKYWKKNHMQEMENYNMFSENNTTREKFKANPNFCTVVLSTADT